MPFSWCNHCACVAECTGEYNTSVFGSACNQLFPKWGTQAECTDLLHGKAMVSDLWDCPYYFGKERKDPRMNKKLRWQGVTNKQRLICLNVPAHIGLSVFYDRSRERTEMSIEEPCFQSSCARAGFICYSLSFTNLNVRLKVWIELLLFTSQQYCSLCLSPTNMGL